MAGIVLNLAGSSIVVAGSSYIDIDVDVDVGQLQLTIRHAFRFIAYNDKREHTKVSSNFHFICEMKDKRQG